MAPQRCRDTLLRLSRLLTKTRTTEQSNSVLVIAASDSLAVRAQNAARAASGAYVTRSALAQASSLATEIRPFAIIIPEPLYEFCGTELDALARDVHAELLVVPEHIQEPVLKALFFEAAARLS